MTIPDPGPQIDGNHYQALQVVCECGRPIEPIDLIEELPANLAMAAKYVMRADFKGSFETDIQKAIWYLNREIRRRARKNALDTCSSVH